MRTLAILLAVSLTVISCGELAPAGPAAAPADTTFLSTPLTDVRTGERFTLGGFPGKVTFFVAMAVW